MFSGRKLVKTDWILEVELTNRRANLYYLCLMSIAYYGVNIKSYSKGNLKFSKTLLDI